MDLLSAMQGCFVTMQETGYLNPLIHKLSARCASLTQYSTPIGMILSLKS